MIAKTQREKTWSKGITPLQQNGGAFEQAKGMFEAKPYVKYNDEITDWEVRIQ